MQSQYGLRKPVYVTVQSPYALQVVGSDSYINLLSYLPITDSAYHAKCCIDIGLVDIIVRVAAGF